LPLCDLCAFSSAFAAFLSRAIRQAKPLSVTRHRPSLSAQSRRGRAVFFGMNDDANFTKRMRELVEDGYIIFATHPLLLK
jgi:hypothetical protein